MYVDIVKLKYNLKSNLNMTGIPLFYMELALGQFTSSGPLTCWNFAPILKGSQYLIVIN